MSAPQEDTAGQLLPEPQQRSDDTESTAFTHREDKGAHHCHSPRYDELLEDDRVRWEKVSFCTILGKCIFANIIWQGQHEMRNCDGQWVAVDVQTLEDALDNQSALQPLVVKRKSRGLYGWYAILSDVIPKTICGECSKRLPAIKLNCGHFICYKCIRNGFFTAASSTESHSSPTHCGRRIPISVVMVFINEALYARHCEAAKYWSTPTIRRRRVLGGMRSNIDDEVSQ